MSQYCGTYEDGVRDDRVQVLTTDGEQVVTIQDSGVDGGYLVGGGDFVTVDGVPTAAHRAAPTSTTSSDRPASLRLSDGGRRSGRLGGPTPRRPVHVEHAGGQRAATGAGRQVHLGELIR